MLARNVTVTDGILNLNYNEVNLGSIYGIYDKTTDKMTVHIPLAVAPRYMHLSSSTLLITIVTRMSMPDRLY
jgi:hypothetical protein